MKKMVAEACPSVPNDLRWIIYVGVVLLQGVQGALEWRWGWMYVWIVVIKKSHMALRG